MTKVYSGIGSRETPKDILELMNHIAFDLADQGWKLRSGGAHGADKAFQDGVESFYRMRRYSEGFDKELRDLQEIYIPWNGFNGLNVHETNGILLENNPDAHALAAQFHPAYEKLTRAAKTLMARNCYQVLGKYLNEPVRFVICWTPDASLGANTSARTGGTGQALRVAFANDIEIYNLADPEHYERLSGWLERGP